MASDFAQSYEKCNQMIATSLRTDKSFDILTKRIKVADKKATLYAIDGFIKDDIVEKMIEYLSKIPTQDMEKIHSTQEIVDNFITYIENNIVDKKEEFVTFVLSGALGLIVEGFSQAIIIDTRTYPAREVQEPESDKVLRGSHEGFVETIIHNTALIRRKIRDPSLTMEVHRVGEHSKSDIVLCFIEGKADKKLLDTIRNKIDNIQVRGLTMSQESLRECLIPSQQWNPFPKVRFTERPDAAAACVSDGNVLILCDGSPSAMIFPTGIFDFVQDINDYYFSPIIGTFIRYVRIAVFIFSLILTPMWYILVTEEKQLPDYLEFVLIEKPNGVPILAQLLIVEFVVDTLKLASLNTPSALSNSFSVVGALVLGEFAVSSGWFVPEVVLFMAFAAISSFTQPSYELGYAIKLARIGLLILSSLFNWWGFGVGLLIIMLMVCFTKTVNGYTYLYPVYPFNKDALLGLLVRRKIISTKKKK